MKDNRDPQAVGELLLNVADAYGRNTRPGEFVALSEVADYARGTLEDHVPDFRGDESPVDRYGDPRQYDVEVTTTVSRVYRAADMTFAAAALPIDRLAR